MKWCGIIRRDRTRRQSGRRLIVGSVLTVSFVMANGGFEVFGKGLSSDPDALFETSQPAIVVEPKTAGPMVERNAPAKRGNPLWQIPFSALNATRDRPVFSSSRRAPAPPAVATVYVPPPPSAPAPISEPDHPLLTLVGTVAGDTDEIGIFLDDATSRVLRLKVGQDFGGWILRSVRGRSAEFSKAGLTATLGLPARNSFQAAAPLRLPPTPVSNPGFNLDAPLGATLPQPGRLPPGQAAAIDPWMGPMQISGKNKN